MRAAAVRPDRGNGAPGPAQARGARWPAGEARTGPGARGPTPRTGAMGRGAGPPLPGPALLLLLALAALAGPAAAQRPEPRDIRASIVEALGLARIPDPAKVSRAVPISGGGAPPGSEDPPCARRRVDEPGSRKIGVASGSDTTG